MAVRIKTGTVFCLMLYATFVKKYQVQITQRFLERGHTQMQVDSVHRVERKIKHKSVYVPQNYVDVIREACSVHPY